MLAPSYVIHYNYFNNYYKMIIIDLSKQQALDLKVIQQIILRKM